jgi:hypothetical protein
MKSYFLIVSLFAVLYIGILNSCKKDELDSREYPRLITLSVSDIDSTGAVFSGEVLTLNNEEIIDHGFVWSTNSSVLPNAEFISLGVLKNKGTFNFKIDYALAINKKYKVKAYLKTATYTVYGNELEFESLGSNAPVLLDYWPKTARLGDSIFVKAKNISRLGNVNSIILQDTFFLGKMINESTIGGIIPYNLKTNEIRIGISVYGNSSYSNTNLKILSPEIYQKDPIYGGGLDTIVIRGKYLKPFKYGSIKFGDISSKITFVSDTLMKFLVPESLSQVSCPIDMKVGPFSYSINFNLYTPVVYQTDPVYGSSLDTISITGKYLRSLESVMFGDLKAKIISSSDSKIQFIVPTDLTKTTYSIYLKFGPFAKTLSFKLDALHISESSQNLSAPPYSYKFRAEGIIKSDCKVLVDGSSWWNSTIGDNYVEVKFYYNELNDGIHTIEVESAGKVSNELSFKILNPVFYSKKYSNVQKGETLTYYGKNLIHIKSLYIEGIYYSKEVTVISNSDDFVKFIVPEISDEINDFRVFPVNLPYEFDTSFSLKEGN